MPPKPILSAPPRVSVLLPVRNVAAYLPDALASMARQTFQDFELILADDGSEDASLDVASEWAEKDPRIRVLALPHQGISPTLQAAFRESVAPWVARMDGDDISHPERLRLLVQYLEAHPGVDVVGSRICGFPHSRITPGMRRYETWQNELMTPMEMQHERFVESPLAHASALMRKEALQRVGGWRDVDWPEDLDLWLRMFRAGATFAKLPRQLYFWRERSDRTTRNDPRLSRASFRRCTLHHLCKEPSLQGSEVRLQGFGKLGRSWKTDLEAAGYRVHYTQMDRDDWTPPAKGNAPLILAIGSARLRGELRKRLICNGWDECREFYFVL